MNRIFIISLVGIVMLASTFYGCQQGCVNNILLQTTAMNIAVNSENLGVSSIDDQNSTDTIRSSDKQFYSYPEFRQFGSVLKPAPPSFVNTAHASDDCPDQQEYISRLDPEKTKLSLNIEYDASALGLGILPADTNLLNIELLKDTYLLDILDDAFLNAGAPTPVTIDRDFFEPVNNSWATFQFYFEEVDGTVFADSVTAYIEMAF